MKNIREIVAENLVNLRKQHSMTQLEIAKQINYSDKAVSRWENGEVLPDVEILDAISKVYNVPVSYLLEEHNKTDIEKQKSKEYTHHLATELLLMCALWTIVTVIYVYIQIYFETSYWQIFVWGVPASCILAYIYNMKWTKLKLVSVISSSVFVWSFIASIYLQFLSQNLYLLFIIGFPIQLGILLQPYTKPIK